MKSAPRKLLTSSRKVALVVAALLVLTSGMLNIFGMRSDVAFLSSGPASDWDAACGVAYVLAWFAAIIVAPALALFVLLDVGSERLPGFIRWIASSRR